MKRSGFFLLLVCIMLTAHAQITVNDSTYFFLDSLYMDLPEVMITGERPMVKSEPGKLIYDLPRIVENLPVDNAYDAIKELPGIMDTGDGPSLAGNKVHIIIDGKISTLSAGQLTELLRTIPVSRIEKAEVMHATPARYQVRGPAINLILKKGSESRVTGELYSAWRQRHYAGIEERASLLYSSPKLSTDLLYSYNQGKSKSGMDKEVLHTVNETVFPLELIQRDWSKRNSHNIRLGMDYTFAPEHQLSLVYTTQIYDYKARAIMKGTQNSETKRDGDDQLHNVKADYQLPFGLNMGGEFTFYEAPGKQFVSSTMDDNEIDIRYDEEQRINKWRFYATQEHDLRNNWGLNYGANYTTVTDNSFQNYFDRETGTFHPNLSMKSRREEYTVNTFAGFGKSFGNKLFLDASLAAEYYHSDTWDEWMFYPTVNVNYIPSAGNMFQFSLSSDKKYPEFWSLNNAVAYLSTYSEIHGNPELKPSSDYTATLTYILKSKYMFSAYFSHQPDYFVQTLYQNPDRLVEVFKFMNFNYQQQYGLQMVIPFKAANWLNSRITAVGYQKREKDDDFWNIPFNRRHTSFMVSMNNTIMFPFYSNLQLTVSGFYQNGSIQGIYDLSRSGSLNTSLRWTSDNQKFVVTLKGNDLLNTSQVNPDIDFKGQYVKNRFVKDTRTAELSFSYKLGNYKEKKREDVDTSRFK